MEEERVCLSSLTLSEAVCVSDREAERRLVGDTVTDRSTVSSFVKDVVSDPTEYVSLDVKVIVPLSDCVISERLGLRESVNVSSSVVVKV